MFTQYKLPNGLRVILAPKHETNAVSLLVVAKVGSRSEVPSEQGIAHFLEHLMFKGTKRRPNTQIISQELDAIGADYNAYTSKDHTAYYIKASSAHLELVADMLSDMLTESIFAPEELERERGTILEEINMYEDNPMAKVGDLFEEDMFGKNTALGHHVIGTPAHIKSITQKQIVAYWKKHYQAANMVVA
ncbi:MAG: pitrilysin family protein, partial [Patescibacteria group bacterium]